MINGLLFSLSQVFLHGKISATVETRKENSFSELTHIIIAWSHYVLSVRPVYVIQCVHLFVKSMQVKQCEIKFSVQ